MIHLLLSTYLTHKKHGGTELIKRLEVVPLFLRTAVHQTVGGIELLQHVALGLPYTEV